MESANLNDKELTILILYGLEENGINSDIINQTQIRHIIEDYKELCNQFQLKYVNGELDTFKRAACFMVAINDFRLIHDKRINASVAASAAYKMCEKPYWNVGENYNIPKKLEEVNFNEAFANSMDVYTKSRKMIIDSLVFEKGSPINYYLNLELFYQVALQLKEKTYKIQEPNNTDNLSSNSTINNEYNPSEKQESKCLKLLKKFKIIKK